MLGIISIVPNAMLIYQNEIHILSYDGCIGPCGELDFVFSFKDCANKLMDVKEKHLHLLYEDPCPKTTHFQNSIQEIPFHPRNRDTDI